MLSRFSSKSLLLVVGLGVAVLALGLLPRGTGAEPPTPFPVPGDGDTNINVPTEAQVPEQGSSAAPVINYKWENVDMDPAEGVWAYFDGLYADDDAAPGLDFWPWLGDDPEPLNPGLEARRIRYWAAVHDPNGIGDIFEVWVNVYEPADADGDTLLNAYECYTGPLAGNLDHDGDGCVASEEQVLNLREGRWYDFFDAPAPANDDPTPNGVKNRAINLQDLVAVLKYVGTFDGGPPNGNNVDYDSDKNGDTLEDGRGYDRSPSARPNPPHDAGPPDGAVNLQDVVVVQNQVSLNCSGPP